jgi:hypothetical protein
MQEESALADVHNKYHEPSQTSESTLNMREPAAFCAVATEIFNQTAVRRETKEFRYNVVMSENGWSLCLKIPERQINYRIISRCT